MSDLDELERERRFAAICQYGDPVLRAQTRRVDRFDDALRAQAEYMVTLMDRADGAGLAAPQIGVLRRVFVYRPEESDAAVALVNPEIVERDGERETELEGCLSIGQARINVEVERDTRVRVEACLLDGTPLTIDADGRDARVLQHEIDHLDGTLMLDRTAPEQRRAALRALREGRAWRPDAPPADLEAVSE